jgi:2-C-methyl-D-erythritol 4-phosphate cytidylyltransferase
MGTKVVAVVPAAGLGERFGSDTNKPFERLLDKPLVMWALEALEASGDVSEIIPVFKERDMEEASIYIENFGFSKVKSIAKGGPRRQDSVMNGLGLVKDASSTVLVHDGARPLLDAALVRKCIEGLDGFDGAVVAVPPKDTIKEADNKGVVRKTLRRGDLWAVQTPQAFPYAGIMDAYEAAARENYHSTDDSSLVEWRGGRVNIVQGLYENLKVTTPEDMDVAAMLIKRRHRP